MHAVDQIRSCSGSLCRQISLDFIGNSCILIIKFPRGRHWDENTENGVFEAVSGEVNCMMGGGGGGQEIFFEGG